jgi:hypothetical protein
MRWTEYAGRVSRRRGGLMRSVSTGVRQARRLAGALGAVAVAGAVLAAAGPSPADDVSAAIVVCPDQQGGCTASNHNRVLL